MLKRNFKRVSKTLERIFRKKLHTEDRGSGNTAFQHALRGPLFVSAYHPALTCPDSLWVPLTFYFRINGLLNIQFSLLKRRIDVLSSNCYHFYGPDLLPDGRLDESRGTVLKNSLRAMSFSEPSPVTHFSSINIPVSFGT